MLSRLISFLSQLFSSKSAAPSPARRTESAPNEAANVNARADESSTEPAPEAPESARPGAPAARARINPDFTSHDATLRSSERELLKRIDLAVEKGNYTLPRLPSSVQKLMGLAANPNVDMEEIAAILSTDPSLSGETFKVANSVMVGAAVNTSNMRDAVVRLGIRRLRSVILSMSMRSAILRDKTLLDFAEEIWRQAASVARISSGIARSIGMDPDKAYLMGLTHDIGKVALLGVLSKKKSSSTKVSATLLGRLFVQHHERVGEAMAREWDLPEEVVAIAGHHHEPHSNPTHPREASLVFLAHRMDQLLSMGAEEEFLELTESREMDTLEISDDRRQDLLTMALGVIREQEEIEAAGAAAEAA